MMGDDLEVVIKRTWHPKQRVAVELDASGAYYDGPRAEVPRALLKEPSLEILFIGGDFGGGKTAAASDRFLEVCLDNPFEEGVHAKDDHPTSIIVAPTLSDVKKSALVEFRRVARDLIDSERLYGEHQDITLINGHRILLFSAEGAMNGPTACQLWADELQERAFDGKWDNLQGRVRDRRARRLNVQATGIARRGNHVERLFGGLPVATEEDFVRLQIGGNTPARRRAFYRSLTPAQRNVIRVRTEDVDGATYTRASVLFYPEDNAANTARGYAQAMRNETHRPRDEAGWLTQAEGVVYPEFSYERNVLELVTVEEALRRPMSLSVDFGRRAAVAFGLPVDRPAGGRALQLIDELMPLNMDAERLAKWIDQVTPWRVGKGSVIVLDPTAEEDQVNDFRRQFPGAEIVQFRSGPYHLEDTGERAVQRALLDSRNEAHLYVHPRLCDRDRDRDPEGRGTVPMFGEYSQKRRKDHFYEHAADVVRYLVSYFVPLPEGDHEPTKMAPPETKPSPWNFARPSSSLRGGVVGSGSRWGRR